MKKVILLLALSIALAGCSRQAAASESSASTISSAEVPETTVSQESSLPTVETFLPDPTEESLGLSYDAFQIVYNILCEGTEELGSFQGIGPDGIPAWTYETQAYPAAQMPEIVPVGQFEGTYYLVEAGTVVALDVCTGKVLFRNSDFGGSPAPDAMLIDEYGYVYLAGYDRPDFFAMAPDGTTVKKINAFSEDYSGAFQIKADGSRLIVCLERDSGGNTGSFPFPVDIDWLPGAEG